MLIRKRKKKNKISLDGKGQKCLISITRKICFVWSGFRVGSGRGKGREGSDSFPYGPSHLCHPQDTQAIQFSWPNT